MNAPPTAAEVLADPEKVRDADPAVLPAILVQLSTAAAVVAAHLGTLPRETTSTEGDHLVKADEAAALLSMSEDWCLRSQAAKSLRVRNGTDVRFSYQAIQRHIARHRER